MVRFGVLLLLLFVSTPALCQPVLTISNARQANLVAPYAYFLKNVTNQQTYEQVSHLPSGSFQPINRPEVVQLAGLNGVAWLRFSLKNLTTHELFLISSFRMYRYIDVFVIDEQDSLTHRQSGVGVPAPEQDVWSDSPIIPLGRQPKTVFVQIRRNGNAFGDYLHIGDMSQALLYKKQTTRWQSLALGIFVLAFLFALVFFLRLRDALWGWYALLLFSMVLFYIDYYGLLSDYPNFLVWQTLPFFSSVYFYELCWSLFHVQFLNLRQFSKALYWGILGVNALIWLDAFLSRIGIILTNTPVSFIDPLFNWLGLSWGSRVLIVMFLLIISWAYVSLRNFKNTAIYAVAFLSSVVTMTVAMFAWNNFSWLPFIPYNNLWVLGIVVEILVLSYILGERANEDRRQKIRAQQQLIAQLQENLRQRDMLLHIRDQIARDLHDEVGATLTAIATSTKLVQKKMNGQQPDITPILQQIQTDSQQTIHSLRETVWALNPDNDGTDKLLDRLRAVAHQLLTPAGITLTFTNEVTTDTLPAFSMTQGRNLYLVVKEALHNIVKHAQATHAEVLIHPQGEQLNIRITDNGQGFVPAQTGEGDGLRNFQKRALEGSFEVTILTEVGKGTVIEVQLPLHTSHH